MARALSLRWRFLLLIWLVVLVVGGLFSLMMYETQKREYLSGIDAQLMTGALMARGITGLDYHDRIIDAQSITAEEYDRLVEKYNLISLDAGFQYLWSNLFLPDGRIVFTSATSASKDASLGDHAAFFSEHSDPDAFIPVRSAGQATYSTFANEWGKGRMLLIPFEDRWGRTYVYGASISIDELDERLAGTATKSMLLFFVMLLLGALIAFLGIISSVLRPLRDTVVTINDMIDGRRKVQTLAVTREDEVGDLVSAFNRLLASREEQRQRLSLATAGTGIGIWDYDVAADQILWDANMYRIYGVSERDFDAHLTSWQALVHPNDVDAVTVELQSALRDEKPLDIEFRVAHSDGTLRWVAGMAVVIRNEQGQPVRMTGMNWDITERKQAEMMKSQFVSTVSHELRTPLTSIRGAIGLVASGKVCELSTEAHKLLTIANSNCDRLTVLINDLLDFDKLASGQLMFSFEPVEIAPLIRRVLDTNRLQAEQAQVTFSAEAVESGLWVVADVQRLQQVLTNLLSNAIKFSPRGGVIEISARPELDRVRVTVRDFGPGVPPEFQARIFQRFSQADASDTRRQGGTGLGLAISREIIRKMDGEIGLEAKVTPGASFYFSLLRFPDPQVVSPA